jgi:hypothetical protein
LASCQQILAKKDVACSHGTISVDAKPFHVIHMGPMSDVAGCETCSWWTMCATPTSFLSLSWPKLGKLSANFSEK